MNFEKQIEIFSKSDAEYYGDKNFITNSQLGKLAKSPKVLDHYRKYGQDDTNALLFGRAMHMAVFEPDKFSEEVIRYEGKVRRGKEWESFKRDNSEKTIISSSEYESIFRMFDKLMSIPRVKDLITDGVPEAVNCWQDSETGVYCKGKSDMIKNVNGVKMLIDLKTTQEHNEESFRRSCYKYGYDRQAAFYTDGFGGDEFWFIVIEKQAPYDVGVYMCSSEFIEEGRKKYKKLLETYNNYFIRQESDINNYYIESIL
tara:strand:- start:2086 stop:2856 length:771 start_codon:yes stop_codon:yes gene_type:complete